MTRRSRCHCFLDTYALTRTRLWHGICDAVRSCLNQHKPTLVVAHFPVTFENTVGALEAAGMPYEISPPQVTWDWLTEWMQRHPAHVVVTLAGALIDAGKRNARTAAQGPLAVIVVERFPHPTADQALIDFFQEGAATCQMGYYLALDDPIFRGAGHDLLVEVMQQMGLDAHALVTSRLLSNRLKRILAQRAKRHTVWQPAQSAEDWLNVNGIDC